MTCQRCLTGKEVQYRAYTELMEMDVCANCAKEARRLGISLAGLINRNRAAAQSKAGEDRDTETAKSVSTKRSHRPSKH